MEARRRIEAEAEENMLEEMARARIRIANELRQCGINASVEPSQNPRVRAMVERVRASGERPAATSTPPATKRHMDPRLRARLEQGPSSSYSSSSSAYSAYSSYRSYSSYSSYSSNNSAYNSISLDAPNSYAENDAAYIASYDHQIDNQIAAAANFNINQGAAQVNQAPANGQQAGHNDNNAMVAFPVAINNAAPGANNGLNQAGAQAPVINNDHNQAAGQIPVINNDPNQAAAQIPDIIALTPAPRFVGQKWCKSFNWCVSNYKSSFSTITLVFEMEESHVW